MLSLSDSISSANFKSLMVEWLPKIETQLKEELPSNNADPIWQKAVTSAIFNGGKRTRPFLTILGWQTVAKNSSTNSFTNSSIQEEMVLRIAVAIELIHSSSLIFDDLPCMDNATIRRGNQALHLEFGEDKAILVALCLLLKGIEIVIKTLNSLDPGNQAQSLVIDLMHSLGERGLICGQWFDLSAKQSITSQEKNNTLAPLRNLKTMPLIRFALLSGAVLGKATEEQKNVLAKFAELIGEAYQQIDDLLDFISDPDTLGKDAALDKKNDRLNYAYINLDKTILNIEEKLNQARSIILEENYSCNLEKTYLVAFTYYLNNRFQKALSYRSS